MPVIGPADRMCVVIPAYNEAANIGRCLDSVLVAAAACTAAVQIVVVADTCTDRTADIARAHHAHVVTVSARTVGIARAAGCTRAMADGTDGLWLANTDADSVVPSDWLSRQQHHAAAGYDVIAGTVAVTDWHGWPPELRVHYDNFYASARRAGQHHIHGCNLGISAPAYRRLGGFDPVPIGEDHRLVAAARSAGLTVGSPGDIPVQTSARRHARVLHGGFHAFLTAMADDLG